MRTSNSKFSKKKSIQVYSETSHGKSKSDDLGNGGGGVVKGYASREVDATNTAIQNAAELYQF